MTQAPDEREAIVRWLKAQREKGEMAVMSAKDGSRRQRDLAAGVVVITNVTDAIKRGEHLDHLSEQGEG